MSMVPDRSGEMSPRHGSGHWLLQPVPEAARPVVLLARALAHLGRDSEHLRNRWALRSRVLGAALRHWPAVNHLARTPRNGSLAARLRTEPAVAGLLLWPYVHAGWSPLQRCEALAQHHACVDEACPALRLSPGERHVLADLSDIAQGLCLVLDRPTWFQREGELVLNLEQMGMRLFSVAWLIGGNRGQLHALIGAVQGNSAEGMVDIYRDLTKSLHGMRPRDFLLDALRLLAAAAGIRELRAVTDAVRHQRHPFFHPDTTRALPGDYDALWAEQGGAPQGDGWVRLPMDAGVRDLESVPSKKRSMYRKRQAMMDALSRQLQAACQAKTAQAIATHTAQAPAQCGITSFLESLASSQLHRRRRWAVRLTVLGGFAAAGVAEAAIRTI
jgi:uncharacterized protein VirK/YbjX